MKEKIIVSDIDNTIIENGIPMDLVINYIKNKNLKVFLLTHRQEHERIDTLKYISKLNLKYESIIMDKNNSHSGEYKKLEVMKLVSLGYDIEEFIDDLEVNRNYVSELGIKVVNPYDINNK
jgi:metal-responsive CopG/Arc/MetJ family transcriptional regulator